MSVSVEPALPTMDESLFCRLLEGPGRVRVEIVTLAQYFLPFVSFVADNDTPPVQYGAIVRARSDLLAAETVADLVSLLRNIAGESTRLEIFPPACPHDGAGSFPHLPLRTPTHWFR